MKLTFIVLMSTLWEPSPQGPLPRWTAFSSKGHVHISDMCVLFLGKIIPVSNLHITKAHGTESPRISSTANGQWSQWRSSPFYSRRKGLWYPVDEGLTVCRCEENNYNASTKFDLAVPSYIIKPWHYHQSSNLRTQISRYPSQQATAKFTGTRCNM